MQSIDLIPQYLDAFKAQIKPFKGSQDTPENREQISQLIRHYVGQLQLLDLSLSAHQAALLLRNAYVSIV